MPTSMSIGQLARTAGVNVETIRYYQRQGLVAEPPKPLGGHRRYPPDVASRIRFIKRAQALGFTLLEVGNLLRLDRPHLCADARELAARKLTMIEEKVADLAAMRRVLRALIQQCDKGNHGRECPIIQTLARD